MTDHAKTITRILEKCDPFGRIEVTPPAWGLIGDGEYLSPPRVQIISQGGPSIYLSGDFHSSERGRIPRTEGVSWGAWGTQPAMTARAYAQTILAAAAWCEVWDANAEKYDDEYCAAWEAMKQAGPPSETESVVGKAAA